jgi:hypothetical protein
MAPANGHWNPGRIVPAISSAPAEPAAPSPTTRTTAVDSPPTNRSLVSLQPVPYAASGDPASNAAISGLAGAVTPAGDFTGAPDPPAAVAASAGFGSGALPSIAPAAASPIPSTTNPRDIAPARRKPPLDFAG